MSGIRRWKMKPCDVMQEGGQVMKCYSVVIVLSLLAGMIAPLHAVDTRPAGPLPDTPVKAEEGSRDWLDLQRQGEQASATHQQLPPAVQDRIYQRYLDSFEFPIPENFYSRDRFVEGR